MDNDASRKMSEVKLLWVWLVNGRETALENQMLLPIYDLCGCAWLSLPPHLSTNWLWKVKRALCVEQSRKALYK